MIIHLNGWPGVGKFTVARLLSERLGARLVDNHLLHDVAIQCAGFTDPQRWPLYEAVRTAAYDVLATRPRSEILVMTNALCVNTPRDHVAWRHVVDLAVARGVPLVPVVLAADIEENVRRIQSADRSPRKLKAPETLRGYYQQDHIQRPDVPVLIEIDTTHLTPAGTATAIQRHLASLETGGSMQVPGPKFLQMRMPD